MVVNHTPWNMAYLFWQVKTHSDSLCQSLKHIIVQLFKNFLQYAAVNLAYFYAYIISLLYAYSVHAM